MAAPLRNMSKLNWLSMRVGVRYCRANTQSRNIRVIVITLRDLYLKRSRMVNFLGLRVVLLRYCLLYFYWVYFISYIDRLGFRPLTLAMYIRFLYAFSGELLVIILIGVSLKKSMKMIVSATVGIPKKKIKTS